MSPNINQGSIDMSCKLLMDAMKVNPEARPVVMSLVDTLMDHQVPQGDWGTILFCVWEELHNEPSQGSAAYNDGSGR